MVESSHENEKTILLFDTVPISDTTGTVPYGTRVQDLGFRKITLWGRKYVNFSRTQKQLEFWKIRAIFPELGTRVLSF